MTWSARALVYSGRPDPSWRLDEAVTARLLAIWHELLPATVAPKPGGPLGYRGVLTIEPGGTTWLAADGVVTKRAPGTTEDRADPDRRFERALLASAPPGLLPAGIGPPIR